MKRKASLLSFRYCPLAIYAIAVEHYSYLAYARYVFACGAVTYLTYHYVRIYVAVIKTVEVVNSAAFRTREMTVGLYVTVVTLGPIARRYLHYYALCAEVCQISVNRAKTVIRHNSPQAEIQFFCRRMIFSSS